MVADATMKVGKRMQMFVLPVRKHEQPVMVTREKENRRRHAPYRFQTGRLKKAHDI